MSASPGGSFDITIIGSGPGGYVAAIRAAQLGLSTAVVEQEAAPGGTCLHWGCIPAKALLRTAEVLDTARGASAFGVRIAEAELDVAAMHAYRKKAIAGNVKGVEFLFKKNGVRLIRGRGSLAGSGRVRVAPPQADPYTLETRHVVLATGSVVRGLPGVEFDGRRVLNSDHALELPSIPRSMIVVGAGAVGVELASAYRSFGSEVTVVELLPRLIPLEDADLGQELERAFKKRRIAVHTSTKLERVSPAAKAVGVSLETGGKRFELEAETLLIAVGRKPATDGLELAGSGVELDERGFVRTDEMLRTGAAGVYAIGDLLATPALAHVASHEGILAVEHAAGLSPRPIDPDLIPSCTYCRPEVGSVGLSEARARERGHDVVVGRFPFSAIGKAKILNDTTGFIKIVSEKKYDQVLGVHIIGPHATELIAEASCALALEATAESLFRTIHAHPTLSEAMGEAALGVHGRTIHM